MMNNYSAQLRFAFLLLISYFATTLTALALTDEKRPYQVKILSADSSEVIIRIRGDFSGEHAPGFNIEEPIKSSINLQNETPLSLTKTIENELNDSVPFPKKKIAGRFDRGLLDYKYIPKGKWMCGITASYANYDGKDSKMLFSLMKDFTYNAQIATVSPYIGYSYKTNQLVGIKLGYNRLKAKLDNLNFDFGDDLEFSVKNMYYSEDQFSATFFHRSYIGLDPRGRFGLFNETALGYTRGESHFQRGVGEELKDVQGKVNEIQLGLNPGLSVFIMNNVSFEFAVGVLGLKYRSEKQKIDNVDKGTRIDNGLNFKINLLKISLGVIVYL